MQCVRLGYGKRPNKVLEKIMTVCALRPAIIEFFMREVKLHELARADKNKT
jgi:hypothetical protein